MKIRTYLVLYLLLALSSCDMSILWGTGNDGSLGYYTFELSKDSLESHVNKILVEDPDLTKLKTDGGEGTYVKLLIENNEIQQAFVFRYSGNKEYWDSHPNESHISITATKKKDGEFLNDDEISNKEQEEAIKIFDQFFINSLERNTGLAPIRKP